MKRYLAAGAVLIASLWVAANYPDLAWVGVAGLVVSYLLAPGSKKSKSKGRN